MTPSSPRPTSLGALTLAGLATFLFGMAAVTLVMRAHGPPFGESPTVRVYGRELTRRDAAERLDRLQRDTTIVLVVGGIGAALGALALHRRARRTLRDPEASP